MEQFLIYLVAMTCCIFFIVLHIANRLNNRMSRKEQIAYTTRLLENLTPSAMLLIIEAEHLYGSGTGPLKTVHVIDGLYSKIPDEYKKYVNIQNFNTIIDRVFADTKELWNTNHDINTYIFGDYYDV